MVRQAHHCVRLMKHLVRDEKFIVSKVELSPWRLTMNIVNKLCSKIKQSSLAKLFKPGVAIFFILFMIFFLIGILYLLLESEKVPVSPLVLSNIPIINKQQKMQVIGFLPYWNINDKLKIDFKVIDQLIYFNLLIDENAEIIKEENWETEPGWLMFGSDRLAKIIAEARENKKKILFSAASFDSKVMTGIMADPLKRTKLSQLLAKIVKDESFDGVDIDFEYFPEDEDKDFGPNFNLFLKELKNELHFNSPKAILSVDIYPKAIIIGKPYDLNELFKIVDQVILMAYDYTQSNSDTAGPVSPLNASSIKDYSITQTLQAYFYKYDYKNKLILGMPLYGYLWRTYGDEPRAWTYPGLATTINYKKAKQLIREKELEVYWDATASSPWVKWEEDWTNHQLYFDNLESLKLKIDLAKQAKLKGIAFWALGYEEDETELWEYLKK